MLRSGVRLWAGALGARCGQRAQARHLTVGHYCPASAAASPSRARSLRTDAASSSSAASSSRISWVGRWAVAARGGGQWCQLQQSRRLAASAGGDGGDGDAADPEASGILRLTIPEVTGEEADEVCDLLLTFGALSVTMEDAARGTPEEVELFDEIKGRTWPRNNIIALFPHEDEMFAALAVAERAIGRELRHSVDNALDQNWEAAVRAEYRPIEACPGLWVVPSWQAPPDTAKGTTNVILEPGLAFGTGEHPTTRLCLRWLKGSVKGGEKVMDYGCGSGVLAVAALLLGCSRAVGVDVDPLAVKSSLANAKLNAVTDRLECAVVGPSLAERVPPIASVQRTGKGADGADAAAAAAVGVAPEAAGAFDVLVANILLGPLLSLEPRLTAFVKPGGRIALSGILDSQAPQVIEAYSAHFDSLRVSEENGWALVEGVRKG